MHFILGVLSDRCLQLLPCWRALGCVLRWDLVISKALLKSLPSPLPNHIALLAFRFREMLPQAAPEEGKVQKECGRGVALMSPPRALSLQSTVTDPYLAFLSFF